MIPMGISGLIGDQLYLKGLYEKDPVRLEAAGYVFPFEREIIIGPAQFYFRDRIINNSSFIAFKNVLKYDPYSVQFLGVTAQLDYLYGNKNEALTYIHMLKLIAPNSNVLKQITETMKGLH